MRRLEVPERGVGLRAERAIDVEVLPDGPQLALQFGDLRARAAEAQHAVVGRRVYRRAHDRRRRAVVGEPGDQRGTRRCAGALVLREPGAVTSRRRGLEDLAVTETE